MGGGTRRAKVASCAADNFCIRVIAGNCPGWGGVHAKHKEPCRSFLALLIILQQKGLLSSASCVCGKEPPASSHTLVSWAEPMIAAGCFARVSSRAWVKSLQRVNPWFGAGSLENQEGRGLNPCRGEIHCLVEKTEPVLSPKPPMRVGVVYGLSHRLQSQLPSTHF